MPPLTPRPELTLVVADSAPGPLGPDFATAVADDVRAGLMEVVTVSEREPGAVATLGPGARWIASPADSTVPDRRALGLAAARTPLVALTESFCVPAPGWAQAILDAHAIRDVAAVGGAMTRRSGGGSDLALTFVEYGRFFHPRHEGPVQDLPGVNVAYRVERLREALGGLPNQVVEVELHAALRKAGEVFWRAPAAVMLDGSRVPPRQARRAQFRHGRFFGGRRVASAGVGRRLLRAALAPAVPLVLGSRIARGVLAAGRGRELVRSLPHLATLLVAWAAGEAVGSVAGEGRSGAAWR